MEGLFRFATLEERGRLLSVCRSWRSESERPCFWLSLDARRVFAAYGAEGLGHLRSLLASRRFSLLEEVNLECCPVGDAELALLLKVKGTLKRLNLNALHGTSPAAIEGVVADSAIESLDVYWHPDVGDAFLRALPSTVTDLNVSGCQRVTDAGFLSVAKKCRLRTLDVTRCPKLSDSSLKALAPRSKLEELVAYADSQFTDFGFAALTNYGALERLRKLDTCGARQLTAPALAGVVKQCGKTLTYLNLSWCVALDDRAGEAVARNCTRLDLLSFHGIVNITDRSIDALARSKVKDTLTTLDIQGCKHVTDYRRQTDRLFTLFPNVSCWTHHR